MSETEAAPVSESDEASAKLSEGLKTCRTVIEDYRSRLIGGEADSGQPESAAPEITDDG